MIVKGRTVVKSSNKIQKIMKIEVSYDSVKVCIKNKFNSSKSSLCEQFM